MPDDQTDIADLPDDVAAVLVGVLERARDLGYLGPGPVAHHVHHAVGFEVALDAGCPAGAETRGRRVVDLGSGAGVPGLVLALRRRDLAMVLLDGSPKRASFVRSAADELGLVERVEVVAERAEDYARNHRGRIDAVVARGFATPAVTAECAAPLLSPGGLLVTSEPPVPSPGRWPADGLAVLGLSSLGTAEVDGRGHFHTARLVTTCPDRYPRRVGVPEKRPLWDVPRGTSRAEA